MESGLTLSPGPGSAGVMWGLNLPSWAEKSRLLTREGSKRKDSASSSSRRKLLAAALGGGGLSDAIVVCCARMCQNRCCGFLYFVD